MATTIYATFVDTETGEQAVGALLDYGVRPEDVTLVRKKDYEVDVETPPDTAVMQSTAGAAGSTGVEPMPEVYVKGSSRANDDQYDNLTALDGEKVSGSETTAKAGITPTTAADAGAGAIKGAEIGLGVGALAALLSIFVPGFGLIAGGGALALALSGVVATAGAGAVAGAITGYLKDQGMDSHVAEKYGTTVSEGAALISVDVPSGTVDESTVRSILDKYGAANVTNFARKAVGGYVA